MNNAFKIGLGEIGTKEIVGAKHNPQVLKYYKEAGHSWVKDDEVAWCAAFMGYCLEKAGIKSTRKLNARSYLKWGKGTTKPQIGDIVVLWRGKRSGWQGHLGFFVREDKDGIWILGGNQSNQVSIVEYPKYRLLGYREIKERVMPKKIGFLTATDEQLVEEILKRLSN